jgi:uncharacterized protein YndB with AHSA1/START domain
MVKVEISFLVEKPIDQVFELISDVANYWRWAPEKSYFFIENKITSKGTIGLGMTYVDRLKWRGKTFGEVVEYQPPYKIRFQQNTVFDLSSFHADIEYTLKSEENFTEVVHKVEATPSGLFRLLEPILSMVVRSERQRTCEAIKDALEQEQQS